MGIHLWVALSILHVSLAASVLVSIPQGTASVSLPSGVVIYSPGHHDVHLNVISYEEGSLAAPEGFLITEVIATDTPTISFQPPSEVCFVECFEFNVTASKAGARCPMTWTNVREARCSCSSGVVTYQYQGKVCEPENGAGFLVAIIVYFFLLCFSVDHLYRVTQARGQIYLLVAVICIFRIAHNIMRLPSLPEMSDLAKACLLVIPGLLQFIILRFMLIPKPSCMKWVMNVVTLIFLAVCAIAFASIEQGSGSYLVVAVLISLCLMLFVCFVILSLWTCIRPPELFFVDKARVRAKVFVCVLFVLSIENGCLAVGFWADSWLLPSTIVFIIVDLVFLELALFYHYHCERTIFRRVAPQPSHTLVEMGRA